MSLFDTVRFSCPKCSDFLEVRTDVGDCVFTEIPSANVPIAMAESLKGRSVYCRHCDCEFSVKMPTTVPLELI